MVRQLLQVDSFKPQKFADYETWDNDLDKLVMKKMLDIYECDGCGKQIYDVLETVHQIVLTKCALNICSDCMKVLRR